jgi:hypothetical protein
MIESENDITSFLVTLTLFRKSNIYFYGYEIVEIVQGLILYLNSCIKHAKPGD